MEEYTSYIKGEKVKYGRLIIPIGAYTLYSLMIGFPVFALSKWSYEKLLMRIIEDVKSGVVDDIEVQEEYYVKESDIELPSRNKLILLGALLSIFAVGYMLKVYDFRANKPTNKEDDVNSSGTNPEVKVE